MNILHLISIFFVAVAFANAQRCAVLPAMLDSSISEPSATGGHTLFLFAGNLTNGVTQFIFSNGSGQLASSGASRILTGHLVPMDGSNPSNSFDVSIAFAPANGTFQGESQFTSAASINPSSWQYFDIIGQGKLFGSGMNSGRQLNVTMQMPSMPLQIGNGANDKNLDFGGALWVVVQENGVSIDGDFNFDLSCNSSTPPPSSVSCTQFVASSAVVDRFANTTGGVVFSFFNSESIPELGSQDFIFSNGAGLFTFSNSDQTVTLTGTAVPADGNLTSPQLHVRLVFNAVLNAPMGPHLELASDAYAANGGPVNPSTWRFFGFDASASSVTSDMFSMTVSPDEASMPLQIGYGANGKNVGYGAAVWLEYFVSFSNGTKSASSTFDININLNCADGSSNINNGQTSVSSDPTASSASIASVSFAAIFVVLAYFIL